MTYQIKEVFYTLQGEGFHAGRPSVFCRFSGCNLWSGREADRSTAQCRFCDTDFVGMDGTWGGKYRSAEELADRIASLWPHNGKGQRMVVLTGGEPMLQIDVELLKALHDHHFMVAVETNGTLPVPPGIDWVCVSPKAGTELIQVTGQELKLVFPQAGLEPEHFSEMAFDNLYLQPMDGPRLLDNTKAAIAYCHENPSWHLSVQVHKVVGIR